MSLSSVIVVILCIVLIIVGMRFLIKELKNQIKGKGCRNCSGCSICQKKDCKDKK